MEPIIGILVSVSAAALFSFLSVATWSDNRRREREAFYRAEMVKKISEQAEPGASKALEAMRLQDEIDQRRQREGQKLGGLIAAAVGVALTIFILVATGKPGAFVGLIPLAVGVAMLFYVYKLAPK